jgi:predicted dehydrogenase
MPKTPTTGRVRYAVIGLGHIAQAAVLPAFANAANAELAALVSDDAAKLRQLGRMYGVPHAFSYGEYERALDLVDAVYIALPNSEHADYTVRAAAAGVHVLCEKPLAVTVEECERMIEACRTHRVKLMTGYRLHFERITLEVIDRVRGGEIGEPKYFNSTFSTTVKEGDIRTQQKLGGGTLYDIGVYCINAARHVFGAEPKEVVGAYVNSVPDRLPEIDESAGAILRFEGEQIATFVTSFNAANLSSYRIVGTRGDIVVEPAYEYAVPLRYRLTVNGATTEIAGERTDQFGPELVYFADCILQDVEPEPGGEEGLQDVRIIQALYESAETGRPIEIQPYAPDERPSGQMRITRPAVDEPDMVNTEPPHRQ